jgi:transcriptional regulator with XRE-family HTH domain
MTKQQLQFSLRLRELREAAGLTQAQLAERAGLHLHGLTKLEQGQREPAWATVQALSAALGVNCDAFNQPAAADSKPSGPGRPPKTKPEAPAPKPTKPQAQEERPATFKPGRSLQEASDAAASADAAAGASGRARSKQQKIDMAAAKGKRGGSKQQG